MERIGGSLVEMCGWTFGKWAPILLVPFREIVVTTLLDYVKTIVSRGDTTMKQASAPKILTFVALLTISSSASAIVVGWGAESRNTTFGSCPLFCTNARTVIDGGDARFSAAATESTFGLSRGDVDMNAPLRTYLPVLKAESIASAGGGSRATITGVQGFTYTGLTATTITLTLNLDVFLDRTAAGTPEASAQSDVAVFFTNNLPFVNDFATVKFEVGAASFRGDESTMRADIALGSQGNVTVSDTFSFDVLPGDEFLVWAGLRTFAERGGVADVFNTFTLTFDDDTGLTAAGIPDSPAGGLDHFKCYEAEGDDNLDVSVELEDQFGSTTTEIEEAELFCNPVDKNGEGIFDNTAHLTGYELDDDDEDFERRTVTISNQFVDEQVLGVEKPELLLVPSEKNGIPSDLNLDHFKCSKVKHRKDVDVEVSLKDQFSDVSAKVGKSKLFCNPVDKNGEGIIDDTAYLTCYDIKADDADRGVYVINNLPDNQWLELEDAELLCVPSELLAVVLVPDDDEDEDEDDDDDD